MSLTVKTLLAVILLFIFAPVARSQNAQDGWVFKNEKDGVKVYYRKTPAVHEMKLSTSIKTPLSGIVKLFSEVELYPQWGYKIMESRVLHRVSETEVYYYSRFDFPWPLSDRDVVMHSQLVQNPNNRSVVAVSNAAPDYLPPVKDVVRIRTVDTRWVLMPGADGWLYVEYFVHSDPGGNLPDWLVNLTLDVGPRETIKNIRRFLARPEYQAARLAYLKE